MKLTKRCPHCGETKRLSAFGWRKEGSKRSWCKSCEAVSVRGQRKSDLQRRASVRLSRQAKSFWTDKQFKAAWRKQHGLCAICHTPMSELKREGDSAVHADHDPLLNKPRGLLCKACNVGLGYFKDDPATLERAALYLSHHSSNN